MTQILTVTGKEEHEIRFHRLGYITIGNTDILLTRDDSGTVRGITVYAPHGQEIKTTRYSPPEGRVTVKK